MPYIPNDNIPAEDGRLLDPDIENLAFSIQGRASVYGYDGAYAGLLNYAISRVAALVTPVRRYWALDLTHGTLIDAAAEFRRRIIVPYEDEQIAKNGDVPEYRVGSRLRP
jgi:hypothetical protein